MSDLPSSPAAVGLVGAESGDTGAAASREVSTLQKQKRYIRSTDELDGSSRVRKIYKAYDSDEGVEVALHVVPLLVGAGSGGVLPSGGAPGGSEPSLPLEHEHLIRVLDTWREAGALVYVTPIVTAGTLQNYIARIDDVRFRVIRKWCRQILSALGHLHAHGMSHGDVRLANVYINGETGNVLVGNFLPEEGGGGRTVDTEALRRMLRYAPPETFAAAMPEMGAAGGAVLAPRPAPPGDVYAFGMCLLEMVTRALPYGTYGDTREEVLRLEVTKWSEALPPEFDEIEARVGVGAGEERRGPRDTDSAREDVHAVKELLRVCLAARPGERPSVPSLLSDFEFLRERKDERDDRERDRKLAAPGATPAAVGAASAAGSAESASGAGGITTSAPRKQTLDAAAAAVSLALDGAGAKPAAVQVGGTPPVAAAPVEVTPRPQGLQTSPPKAPSQPAAAAGQAALLHSASAGSEGSTTARERAPTLAPGSQQEGAALAAGSCAAVPSGASVLPRVPDLGSGAPGAAASSAGPIRASHKYVVTTSSIPVPPPAPTATEAAGTSSVASAPSAPSAPSLPPSTGPHLLGLSLQGLKFGRSSLGVTLALYYWRTSSPPSVAYRLVKFVVERGGDPKDLLRKVACELVAANLMHPDDVDAVTGWLVAALAGILTAPHIFDAEASAPLPPALHVPAERDVKDGSSGRTTRRSAPSVVGGRVGRPGHSRSRTRTGSGIGAGENHEDEEGEEEEEDGELEEEEEGEEGGDGASSEVGTLDARSTGARSRASAAPSSGARAVHSLSKTAQRRHATSPSRTTAHLPEHEEAGAAHPVTVLAPAGPRPRSGTLGGVTILGARLDTMAEAPSGDAGGLPSASPTGTGMPHSPVRAPTAVATAGAATSLPVLARTPSVNGSTPLPASAPVPIPVSARERGGERERTGSFLLGGAGLSGATIPLPGASVLAATVDELFASL